MAPTSPQHCQRQRQAATQQLYGAGGSSPKGVGVTSFPALGNPSAVEPGAKGAHALEMTMVMDMLTLKHVTTTGIAMRTTEVGQKAPIQRGGGVATRAPTNGSLKRSEGTHGMQAAIMTEGSNYLESHGVMTMEGLTGARGPVNVKQPTVLMYATPPARSCARRSPFRGASATAVWHARGREQGGD